MNYIQVISLQLSMKISILFSVNTPLYLAEILQIIEQYNVISVPVATMGWNIYITERVDIMVRVIQTISDL